MRYSRLLDKLVVGLESNPPFWRRWALRLAKRIVERLALGRAR